MKLSEYIETAYIAFSGIVSILLIVYLSDVDSVFAGCVGVLLFFLMMLLLFLVRLFGRIKKRKETENDRVE